MPNRVPAAALVLLLSASAATAADLRVDVRDSAGRPVPDAVVSFKPAGGVRAPGLPQTGQAMVQQNIRFEPGVLVVPVGAVVAFPNRDKVRHHVYSFSKPKRFELKLYGREEARTVTFDKPGIVPIGCNIHDQMSGHIVVVDTPHVRRTGADGATQLGGLPAGGGTLTVWHPRLRNAQTGVTSTATAGGRASVTLDLRGG